MDKRKTESENDKLIPDEIKDLSLPALVKKVKSACGLNPSNIFTWLTENGQIGNGYRKDTFYALIKEKGDPFKVKKLKEIIQENYKQLIKIEFPIKKEKGSRIRTEGEIEKFILKCLNNKRLNSSPIKFEIVGFKLTSIKNILKSIDWGNYRNEIEFNLMTIDPNCDEAKNRFEFENSEKGVKDYVNIMMNGLKKSKLDWSMVIQELGGKPLIRCREYTLKPERYVIKCEGNLFVSPYDIIKGKYTFYDTYKESINKKKFEHHYNYIQRIKRNSKAIRF